MHKKSSTGLISWWEEKTRGGRTGGFGRLRICDGWRRGGWGSRGDCRLLRSLEEIACCSGQRWGSSSRDRRSTSSTSGGERRQWELASPPQSFRTLLFLTACLFVSSVASSPSLSCRQKFEIKSKGDLENILNQVSPNSKNPSMKRNYCKWN